MKYLHFHQEADQHMACAIEHWLKFMAITLAKSHRDRVEDEEGIKVNGVGGRKSPGERNGSKGRISPFTIFLKPTVVARTPQFPTQHSNKPNRLAAMAPNFCLAQGDVENKEKNHPLD